MIVKNYKYIFLSFVLILTPRNLKYCNKTEIERKDFYQAKPTFRFFRLFESILFFEIIKLNCPF